MRFLMGWCVGLICGLAIWLAVEDLTYKYARHQRHMH
jgi:hypothetical protein